MNIQLLPAFLEVVPEEWRLRKRWYWLASLLQHGLGATALSRITGMPLKAPLDESRMRGAGRHHVVEEQRRACMSMVRGA